MAKRGQIWIVDDEEHSRTVLSELVKNEGYEPRVFEAPTALLAALEEGTQDVDMVITDLQMPEMDGLQLITKGKNQRSDVDFLIVTAHGTVESAIKAIRAGASDYLLKPIEGEELALRIGHLFKLRKLEQRTQTLEQENKRLQGGPLQVVAESPKMKKLLEELDQVAKTDATVLLTGETGVGKEVLARFIHEHSRRTKGPFVPVNCSAIPENLTESEFFGHEKGSFTGAEKRNIGFFESADGGTLFLDEIGEMELKLQPKILRALEDRKVRRVGGGSDIEVDIRLVAATNRELQRRVQEGQFREDLYYRLNVVHIEIPPLRERKADLPALVQNLVARSSKKVNVVVDTVEDDYLAALDQYSFPGNVRELANIVERSLIFAKNGKLTADNLPPDLRSGTPIKAPPSTGAAPSGDSGSGSLNDRIGSYEKQVLEMVLAENNQDVDQTAKALGVSRSTLYAKLSKHGLK